MRYPATLLARLAVLCLLLGGCSASGPVTAPALSEAARVAEARKSLSAWLDWCRAKAQPCTIQLDRASRVDTVFVDPTGTLQVQFNEAFAQIPFREDNVARLESMVATAVRPYFADTEIELTALGLPLAELIPNLYRTRPQDWDRSRMPQANTERPLPLVRPLDQPWTPTQGLQGRALALWPSHGWYYEARLDRWEWQRARVFQTVEDLLPMAFIVPYLAPMLENAGANVFLPRERDVQRHEVRIDHDADTAGYQVFGNWQTATPGFAMPDSVLTGQENPFAAGSHQWTRTAATATDSIRWLPTIPETGDYAVYLSFSQSEENTTDARYTVHHAGGLTRFAVNQQIGGGTWVYLGTFRFHAGTDPTQAAVVLTNASDTPGQRVTADAVRFGGGMGNVVRGGSTSGRPRFVEAARYYMQYAGMPPSLVYNVTDTLDDYTDDYRGRGEWVNYLKGAPFGPNKDRSAPGLGLPIDLSLAFHTDAGQSRSDTTIGTLMIYSSDGGDDTRFFPDGQSRFANRDLGDLLQTQLVEDIRAQYDPVWQRRGIWDRDYSEAFRPNVPAALLELLSHQNYLDMKFALDPRFRFDVSRSIYKAMLRFLAAQHEQPYVVQPLPVSHMQATFTGERQVTIRWQPVEDPLEPSATPTGYVVETRRAEGGFGNGVAVTGTRIAFDDLVPGVIYSYRVRAVNAGGASLPSEILSVCWQGDGTRPVLIVNGFDRVAPPASLEADSLRGFVADRDTGVPDRYDLSYVGPQYEFDATVAWQDDDAPGHGASHATHETTVVAGNTFDYPYLHGQAFQALGRAFVSASDEAVWDGQVHLANYPLIDLILGEERRTPWPKPVRPPSFEAFPAPLQAALQTYLRGGGRLFASGAYLTTDLFESRRPADSLFARDVLHVRHRTNLAAKSGAVLPTSPAFPVVPFRYEARLNPERYAVEAPDGLEPAAPDAQTLLRYAENNISAAVGMPGTVVLFGFPFEAIRTAAAREAVLRAVLAYVRLE